MGLAAAALALALAAALAPGAGAYEKKDVISLYQRAQFRGRRSDWSEPPIQTFPRYLVDEVVSFQPSVPPELIGEHEVKASFAFDDHRFSTPWLTLSDATRDVKKITFLFRYYDGDVASVDWKVSYAERGDRRPRDGSVLLHYRWVAADHDDTPPTGLLHWMLVAFVCYVGVYVCSADESKFEAAAFKRRA
uniref:Uncharacterized protein n=1 Tax=Phaeomonas parva TaxID=124430 RepID=A0A7S1U0A9_9STRA|mmetsp:Transcript_2603/g.7672  ORF Transcript_2603/g.7672 Transcript_2603/m.7672 type:complete len:191 (+) Transcript_2603:121-693(+)